MSEKGKIYIIKHKDPIINDSYLITVKNGKKPRLIRDYRYSRKNFNISYDDIDNYEIIYFKTIKYGSSYERKMIERYYKNELKISN